MTGRNCFFRPGLEFKNARLLEFTRYSLTVMRPWPEPLAWKRTTRKPFRPVRPGIALVPGAPDKTECLDTSVMPRRMLRQFMEPVPPGAFAVIGQFRSRQWHMMAFLARCPGALDLVQSTPALAFALASTWVFRDSPPTQPMRTARRLVRLPQLEICDWLGFPARRSTIKVLRKLRAADISIELLLYLRDGLWDEDAASLLRHCPVITRQTIKIATFPAWRRLFSPRFLAELPAYEESPEQRPMLHSFALNILLSRDVLRQLRPNQMFHSMTQIESVVEELARNARARSPCACPPDLTFAPSPIPGTSAIVPLTTGWELLQESRQMDHCVADMHEAVTEGDAYFYCVLAPERATLSLVRDNTVWRVGELKGPRNAPAAQATWAAVYAWLGASFEGALYAATEAAVAQGEILLRAA